MRDSKKKAYSTVVRLTVEWPVTLFADNKSDFKKHLKEHTKYVYLNELGDFRVTEHTEIVQGEQFWQCAHCLRPTLPGSGKCAHHQDPEDEYP